MAKVTVPLEDAGFFFMSKRRKMQSAYKKGIEPGLKYAVRWVKRKGFAKKSKTAPPVADKITSRSGKLKKSVEYFIGVRRGFLRRSQVDAGLRMTGPQARILEKGGRTRPHIIVPKKAKMLHWIGPMGEHIFAKKVHHPGSVFEPRPVLARGLVHATSRIIKGVKKEVKKEFGKKN